MPWAKPSPMTTTAAIGAVAYITLMQVPGLAALPTSGDEALYFGLRALPIVIPSAFLAGVVAWRTVSPEQSLVGPIAGVAATFLTYLFSTLGVCLLVVAQLLGIDFIAFGLVIGFFGFLLTSWITVPLGALGGAIYERARTASAADS